MPTLPFILNKIYKRTDIHVKYGGNTRSGIVPSPKMPYIFIFSGGTGHMNGYRDEWENKDVYAYTGQGQIGDMQYTRGNLQLLYHVKFGKRVFLFTSVEKGFVRFDGELEYLDSDVFTSPDRNGNDRLAIKFFFKRAEVRLPYQNQIEHLDKPYEDSTKHTAVINGIKLNVPKLNSSRAKNIPNETERKGLVTSRVGQGAYRTSILYRWEFKCAVTRYPNHNLLIASHIVPWKDSTNEERLDVHNGILLSPTYDAFFDKHLISFENNGKIILSPVISSNHYQILGITGKENIKKFTSDNHSYLERHRALLAI